MSDEAGELTADPTMVSDLRMLLVATTAWLGALLGGALDGSAAWVAPAVVGLALGVVVRWQWSHRPRLARTLAAGGLVLVALASTSSVREAQVGHDPVATLAADRAAVRVVGTISSDARTIEGRFGKQRLVRLTVREVVGRGSAWRTRTPVLVIGEPDEIDGVRLGARVSVAGRLSPSDGDDLAAVLGPSRPMTVLADPGPVWRGAEQVRASIRAAVAHRPPAQAALVPALVDGDDASVSDDLAADFRVSGLTHLLAVSGTNLTLLVGFLLVLARWCGVRGRWLLVVAVLGIAGFIVLARTEPSVLRAAVMGAVGLVAMGGNGRRRGPRVLAVAVTVLLLVQPGLAPLPGFALSVLATAGIVLVAPAWRDALARWLPRWLAEAVAVPAAAQLACTPVVAAISGQVSLVAVAANLLVAPAVAPATVLGLAGGLVGLVWSWAGRLLGSGAGWCVAWIVTVAERAAGLPSAAIGWGTTPLALTALTLLSIAGALLGPALLRRPSTGVACAAVLVVVLLVRLPTPGWPPAGWVVVACDVGQGDALVLSSGPGEAVVVDAGPDPSLVDACLDRLGVRRVRWVVLTHFHADHVDGLPGILGGRQVDLVETTDLMDPPESVGDVLEETRAVGLAPRVVGQGTDRTVGAIRLQVLWPAAGPPYAGPGDGSTANGASVVLLAEVRGVRILLTGDIEPQEQAVLARMLPGLDVDVLKMPHHGSRYQDEDWLVSLDPEIVLVSVGVDNDYGHPAASALDPLAAAGAEIGRTDAQGDLAVVATEEGIELRTSGGR